MGVRSREGGCEPRIELIVKMQKKIQGGGEREKKSKGWRLYVNQGLSYCGNAKRNWGGGGGGGGEVRLDVNQELKLF